MGPVFFLYNCIPPLLHLHIPKQYEIVKQRKTHTKKTYSERQTIEGKHNNKHKHQASSIKHQASSIKHQAASSKHQASSIKHQPSSIDPPTPPQRSSRRFGGTHCGHPLQKNPYPYDKTLVIFFSASGSGLKGLDIYPLEASVCIHSVRHPLEASVCIHSVRHPLEASALPPHLP